MIKSIDKIKLKHLDRMERTGKVSQFLEWWNIAPAFLFKKRLEKFIKEVYNIATGNNNANISDIELERLEWKTRSLIKINAIEAAYLACVLNLHLVVSYDYNLNRFRLTRYQRRQIKHVDIKLLERSVQNIRVLTGIEIKDELSLAESQKELIWLKDKYNENFGKSIEEENEANRKQGKKMSILTYAGSFALYAGSSFINLSEMTIPEFVAMRENADAKFQAEKKQYENKNQNFEQ